MSNNRKGFDFKNDREFEEMLGKAFRENDQKIADEIAAMPDLPVKKDSYDVIMAKIEAREAKTQSQKTGKRFLLVAAIVAFLVAGTIGIAYGFKIWFFKPSSTAQTDRGVVIVTENDDIAAGLLMLTYNDMQAKVGFKLLLPQALPVAFNIESYLAEQNKALIVFTDSIKRFTLFQEQLQISTQNNGNGFGGDSIIDKITILGLEAKIVSSNNTPNQYRVDFQIDNISYSLSFQNFNTEDAKTVLSGLEYFEAEK